MFTSEFKEKNEKVILLAPTFSTSAFKEMIRFIYVGKVNDLEKHVYDLLDASEFYQIETLKKLCEDQLLRMLAEDNANLIFQKAHQFNCCENLKKAAFKKIQE